MSRRPVTGFADNEHSSMLSLQQQSDSDFYQYESPEPPLRSRVSSSSSRSSRYKDDLWDDNDAPEPAYNRTRGADAEAGERRHPSQPRSIDSPRNSQSRRKAASFKLDYLGSLLVPPDRLDVYTVDQKMDAILRKGTPSPVEVILNETHIMFDSEARHVSFPIRRVHACTYRISDRLAIAVVEEPRENQFFCHVLEGTGATDVKECYQAIQSAIGDKHLRGF